MKTEVCVHLGLEISQQCAHQSARPTLVDVNETLRSQDTVRKLILCNTNTQTKTRV